eukprot:gene13140-3845_t
MNHIYQEKINADGSRKVPSNKSSRLRISTTGSRMFELPWSPNILEPGSTTRIPIDGLDAMLVGVSFRAES